MSGSGSGKSDKIAEGRTLLEWDPEDEGFWKSKGKKIAYQNLWISIPNLLCGFAVWLYWGMLAKMIQKAHFANPELFNFTFMNDGQVFDSDGYRALMYTLPAAAGLAGATLRIPNSFMIAVCGGRNVKFMTTLMLLLPAIGAGFALQDPNTSFGTFVLLALLSGVGGGAFSSSMSNISFFFPKKMQGLSLGLNAGIGNAGVSTMQFLLPWIITFGAFGSIGGDPYHVGDKDLWIQNAALVWIPILATLMILAFFCMHNMPQHKCGPTLSAVGKYLWLMVIGFVGAGAAVGLLIMPWGGFPVLLKIFVIVLIAVLLTLFMMKKFTKKEVRDNLENQFKIFDNKHNWIMTWLYTMTFGSFIGYANAFPKLIPDVFGVIRVAENGAPLMQSIANPNAPIASNYIWIGAGVGALIRPLGGWLADKFGGARVTHWDTIIMIGATIGAGYYVSLASSSPTPEQYFMPFLLLFVLLFATTGIGNGSTFRMIPIIFSKEQAGPVLGWTSAIAAYGAFLIPKIFATQIKAGTPEYALYGFAGYYASCLAVNWWFYGRKNAEIKC